MALAPVLACLGLLAAVPAAADLVEIQNGVRLEGIVREGSGKGIVLQVATDGFVFLDEGEVLSVSRGGLAERERLRAAWRDEDRRARDAERREREEEQAVARRREKGLVYSEGRWQAPEGDESALRRGPPAVSEAPVIQVALTQQVFAWSLGSAAHSGRRRAPPVPRPFPQTTSSGLLAQPFSVPRAVPINQGIPQCSVGGAGCPPAGPHR